MKYLVILFVVFLGACSTSQNFPVVGINQSYKIIGANVLSPNEPNWHLVKQGKTEIYFGKEISSKADSVIANVLMFGVVGHEDDNDYFDFIISEREKNDDKIRFVNLGVKNTRVNFKNSPCIKYESLAEDHASKSHSKKAFQYFSTRGYICRHPSNKNAAIQLEVSYRSDTKEVPGSIIQLSESFFNTVLFVNNDTQ